MSEKGTKSGYLFKRRNKFPREFECRAHSPTLKMAPCVRAFRAKGSCLRNCGSATPLRRKGGLRVMPLRRECVSRGAAFGCDRNA